MGIPLPFDPPGSNAGHDHCNREVKFRPSAFFLSSVALSRAGLHGRRIDPITSTKHHVTASLVLPMLCRRELELVANDAIFGLRPKVGRSVGWHYFISIRYILLNLLRYFQR